MVRKMSFFKSILAISRFFPIFLIQNSKLFLVFKLCQKRSWDNVIMWSLNVHLSKLICKIVNFKNVCPHVSKAHIFRVSFNDDFFCLNRPENHLASTQNPWNRRDKFLALAEPSKQKKAQDKKVTVKNGKMLSLSIRFFIV